MRTPSLRASLLLFSFSLCCSFGQLAARDLHVVMIIDVKNTLLGGDTDYQNMRAFVETLAASENYRLQPHYFYKREPHVRELVRLLATLPVGPDDVVIFYYSGHGFLDASTGSAAFRLRGTDFSIKTVHERLLAKNPRLLITLYDCCTRKTNLPAAHGFAAARDYNTARMHTLFSQSGHVRMQSNNPEAGRCSFGNQAYGGIFTHSFLETLRVRGDDFATWCTLRDEIAHRTNERNHADSLPPQNPVIRTRGLRCR